MKKSRKEFIIEAHSAACSEWKYNIEKEFPELFKKYDLKINKWYVLTEDYGSLKKGSVFPFVKYQSPTKKFAILGHCIFDHNKRNYIAPLSASLKPATDKEVEEALLKEAKKIGIKEGDLVKCLNDGRIKVLTEYHMSTPDWEIDVKGGFNLGDITVMLDGKWVKPIETITKEQAEKELGKTILN
jgi:hypothetical protein